jgi:hypothetical protein
MNDVTTGQAFKDAAQPTEKLEIAPDILEWFKKRDAFWQQAKWTPRLENALVANPWSIRWTFGIRDRSAVALATRRMFEAGTHPAPPLAAIIAWAR